MHEYKKEFFNIEINDRFIDILMFDGTRVNDPRTG